MSQLKRENVLSEKGECVEWIGVLSQGGQLDALWQTNRRLGASNRLPQAVSKRILGS